MQVNRERGVRSRVTEFRRWFSSMPRRGRSDRRRERCRRRCRTRPAMPPDGCRHASSAIHPTSSKRRRTTAKTVAKADFFCADPRNRACAPPQTGPPSGKIFRCRLALRRQLRDAVAGSANHDPDSASGECMSKKRSFLRFFFLAASAPTLLAGSVTAISHPRSPPSRRAGGGGGPKKISPRC